MRLLSHRNNGKITMRSLHAVAVLMLLSVVASPRASRRITVGPGTGWDYNDINTAVTAQLPFTEDIILEVYVGPGGFTTPGTVEQNPLFAGHTLTIQAVNSFPKTTTFYVGDEIEYELPQDQTLDCRVTEYINSGDALARRVTQGTSESGNQFYVKNHLGSTMFLVSADGNTRVAHYDYFPYGKKVSLGTSPEYTSKTFTGKELDRYDEDMAEGEDGEGWYYFGARYYDGDVGIFSATDPLGEFWNAYSYTGGNPTNLIDPFGLSTWTDESGNVIDMMDDDDLGVYMLTSNGAMFMGEYEDVTNPKEALVVGESRIYFNWDNSVHFANLIAIGSNNGNTNKSAWALRESFPGHKMSYIKDLEKLAPGYTHFSATTKNGIPYVYHGFKMGNLMWGLTMKKLGIPWWLTKAGEEVSNAVLGNLWNGGKGMTWSGDNEYDRRAVRRGYFNE